MKRFFSRCLLANYRCLLPALLLACQACSFGPPALPDNRVPAQTFRFQDGGNAIYFSLDKSLSPTQERIENYFFVISGSDCTSMQYFLPQYFRGLEGEAGKLRLFMLHKRFIEAGTWGRVGGCSDEFIRADYPSRWIADQREFIKAQLKWAKQAGLVPKRVILVGISEGGDIVPMLAESIAEVTHAVILSNGGMNPIDTYRLQAKKHGIGEAAAVLASLAREPADPDAIDVSLGRRTWRYWSELNQLKTADALLALKIPILLAMGEADQLVPIESAQRTHDRFAALGKSNFTLATYAQADHGLVSPSGSQLPHFWHALELWLFSSP